MEDYLAEHNEMPNESEIYDLCKKLYIDNNLHYNYNYCPQCNTDSIFKGMNQYPNNDDCNYCSNSSMDSLYQSMNKPDNNQQIHFYQNINDNNIIFTLKNCALVCHEMIDYLINENYTDRKRQIRLLHDCANICDNQALCFIKKSEFCKEHANLCGKICLTCSEECNKYHDIYSQHIAKICEDCGKSCIDYSKIY